MRMVKNSNKMEMFRVLSIAPVSKGEDSLFWLPWTLKTATIGA